VLFDLGKMLRGPHDAVLRFLHAAMMYDLDLPAFEADKMVVLGKVGKLVVGVVVPEIDVPEDPFFFERFERPIDGRLVGLVKRFNDLLCAQGFFCSFKDIQNRESCRRRFIAAFSEHHFVVPFFPHPGYGIINANYLQII
jgi:hypothetical protein